VVNGTVMVVSPDNFFNPVLDQDVYNISFPENSPILSSVLNFTVTDMDSTGPASEIGEATLFGADGLFAVSVTGPNSGEISNKLVNNCKFSRLSHFKNKERKKKIFY